MVPLKWIGFVNWLANWLNVKQLAIYSFIIFIMGVLCIIVTATLVDLDKTNAIVNLLGVIGLINWISMFVLYRTNPSLFDRNIANTNFKRLFYILLLVFYIPCILNLLLIIIPPKVYAFSSLRCFNDNIIDPFLNHENFGFAKSLISLLGTFFLSGVLVSMLVSLINQRVERWEKGELWYEFKFCDYCAVIGGHDAVPNLIQQLVKEYKRVIVLTNRDIPSFRREVESCLEESQKERVVFYHGYRNSDADLKHLHLERNNLKAIYVLGESRVYGEEETSHDTLNMTCLDIMNNLRGEDKEQIDCYVFFEHQTTSVIFQKFGNNEKYHSLNFIPYNFYELQAQKAIGWDRLEGTTTRLDRFGKNSINADKHVHLVIVGMSKIGQALGLEAIRVCHYPNYAKAQMLFEYGMDGDTKMLMGKRRTKITFIDCNMIEILDSFKCRYERLLDEIQWSYVDYDYPLKSQSHPLRDNNQKIVPDIELEFVNGRIQADEVLEHLKTISFDKSAVLTIASCLSKSNLSIASILCLPKDVLEKAEIMIYQPVSTRLVESIVINENSDKVKAFGEISRSVDLEHIVALETMAKRVNYVYRKKNALNNYALKDFSKAAMISFEEGESEACYWEMEETWRWANRYHASAIWQKARYISNNEIIEKIITQGITENDDCVQEDFEGLMARMEHNRYCIEQWLLDRRTPEDDVFKSYRCLKKKNSQLAEFPTNDQIMTMAVPYIVHDVIKSDTLDANCC